MRDTKRRIAIVRRKPSILELAAVQVLAVAVVRQAVVDLTYVSTLRGSDGRRDVDTRRIRHDARDFLQRVLWLDGCLWGEILPEMGLTRCRVLTLARLGGIAG